MTLIEYGQILIRRGWIILLLALIAAVSAYLLSRAQTPIYRATQTVLIQPARADLSLTESASRLVNNYALYLDSDSTAARVIDALQLDMTPGDLNADVVVNPDALRFSIRPSRRSVPKARSASSRLRSASAFITSVISCGRVTLARPTSWVT